MIRIKNNNLNKIAQKHYTLNLQNIVNALDNKINDPNVNTSERQFYTNVKNDVNCSMDDSILSAKPRKLESIILKYKNFDFKKKSNKDFKNQVLEVFGYNNYDTWGAYALAQDLKVKVCPYCNRQYTFTVNKKKNLGGTRPEFDHFFDKARYPYLSLSFYNLIPSCHICNSNLKGTKEFSLVKNIHPYVNDFENVKIFEAKLKNKKDLSNEVKNYTNFGVNFFYGNLDSFEIKFKDKKNPSLNDIELIKKATINIEAFRLLDLYNQHKDIVAELIQTAIIYHSDKKYVDDLFTQFKGKLFKNREHVLQYLVSNIINDKKLGNRPLAKFTRDIIRELGVQ